jgi:hypothetical protein
MSAGRWFSAFPDLQKQPPWGPAEYKTRRPTFKPGRTPPNPDDTAALV